MLYCQPNVWRKEINNNTNELILTTECTFYFPFALWCVLPNVAVKNCIAVLFRWDDIIILYIWHSGVAPHTTLFNKKYVFLNTNF